MSDELVSRETNMKKPPKFFVWCWEKTWYFLKKLKAKWLLMRLVTDVSAGLIRMFLIDSNFPFILISTTLSIFFEREWEQGTFTLQESWAVVLVVRLQLAHFQFSVWKHLFIVSPEQLPIWLFVLTNHEKSFIRGHLNIVFALQDCFL